MRAHHVLAVFGATCLISLCSPVCSLSSTHSTNVEGRIFFPEGQAPPVSLVKVVLTLEGGKQLRAYPRADLSWRLHGVPPGAHVLETAALGFMMPSVRVDVKHDGAVQATYTEAPSQTLPVPIHIRAVPVEYFDKVVPFNIMAFLKSPMGLMAAFMLFAIVIMPYLKVDPEEMKAMLEEQKQEKAKKAAEQEQLVAAAAAAQQKALPQGPHQRLRNRR